jgi:zinc transport system substrate-binding protein
MGCKDDEATKLPVKAVADSAKSKPVRDTLQVAAAVEPLSWLACQVAGQPCVATTLVPPGASAHTFEPKPSLLNELSRSRVYFSSGLSFESAWVPRLQAGLPSLKVFALRPAVALASQERDHDHASEVFDPHVWSSPRALLPWCDTMAAAMTANTPKDSVRFRVGRDSAKARLLRLDTLVRNELAPFTGKRFYINHPELGYLARDYGLTQMPLEESGREPSLDFLWEARKIAKVQGIRAVFVQGSYAVRTAEGLARELNVPVVSIDLYQAPYDSSILRLVRSLASSL